MCKGRAHLSIRATSNMRMHLQKPRAPWSKADRLSNASFQVIRGR
jgi:hypothetical protein